MKIKALRSNFGDYGHIRRGQIIEVQDEHAEQLIKRGVFTDILSEEKSVKSEGATELQKLNKKELLILASRYGIVIEDADTKPKIVEKLLAVAEDAKAAFDALSELDEQQLRDTAANEGVELDADDYHSTIIGKIIKARFEK